MDTAVRRLAVCAALAVVLSPLVIAIAALMWRSGWGKTVLLAGPALFRLFVALRGLEVDVRDGSEHVLVSFQ